MMVFGDSFRKLNQSMSRWAERVGIFAFLLMMAITCIDVAGAKLFRMPVFGALDIVMNAQLIAISFGAAMTLIFDRHIQVEFFVPLLPKRLQHILECMVHFIGFSLFVLIIWRLFAHGYVLQVDGEESPTAGLPVFPIVYGAAVGSIPVCLVFLERFIMTILKAEEK
jgi:TRAP-type C4-dicarboxylate transport system permease small subunit